MPSKNQLNHSLQMCRKILKQKIVSEKFIETLLSEFSQLLNVMRRTVDYNESDSVLVIGPHGCGKTTLVSESLQHLNNSCTNKDYVIIHLNGLIHIDDNLALKDIIRQLNIESVDSDKFSGSFSDNLQYLLQSFRNYQGRSSKALIFILEEFHLFCSHRNQTLLYNLFDSAQSSQGVCVVGITSRIDVTEMLEKRVKSRFSHRQLLLLYHPTIDQRISLFKKLLELPTDDSSTDLDPVFVNCWNERIEELSINNTVIRTLKRQLEIDCNEAKFRSYLLLLVSRLSKEHSLLNADDVASTHKKLTQDDKIVLLQGLSVLEICLVIAMSHQNEIFDGEPFNFEMIVGRYLKFANQNSAIQITQRPVVLKAFERIKDLELISPVGNTGKNVQKEFQLYNFILTKDQVNSAVNSYAGIPTDVAQWASSSLMPTLKVSWNKLWPDQILETEEENVAKDWKLEEINDRIPSLKDVTNEEIEEWVKSDDTDLGYEILNEEEIVNHIKKRENLTEGTEDEECDDNQVNKMSCKEVVEMLTKCIDWYSDQKDAQVAKLIAMRQVHQFALENERNVKVQKQITDFFKK